MAKLIAVTAAAALIPVSALAQTASQHNNDRMNWTGFYVGFNTGGVFSSSHAQTNTVYSSSGYFLTSSMPVIASTGNQNLHPKGYVGGLQFGYDRQITSRWVLGAEEGYGLLAASYTASVTSAYPCCSPYGFTVTQKVSTDWLATFRARVGYTVTKRSLLFVSGGAAETEVRYSSLFTDNYLDGNESAALSVLKAGWIAGGGGEFALNKRWSARAEYLYADFGSVSAAGTVFTSAVNFASPTMVNWPQNPFTHTANFMWNWGGFASAISRAAPGPQALDAADVTMSWVSIVPRFLW
ncbi:MAG: outer membrane beta-barrel protein, partial [Terracidiphilus sp.]